MSTRCCRPTSHPYTMSSLNRARRLKVESLLDTGLPYSRRLRGHTACVNALVISHEGRWLASGGDDNQILLWDFHQDKLQGASQRLSGHRTNIFALAFSATNRYLYSGAVDNSIHRYDLEHSHFPVDSRYLLEPDTIHLLHKDSIRGLSCHPQQDVIFLSASDDGCIIMYDMRAESSLTRAQGTLQHDSEFTSVQFHPYMHHIFVTSDSRGEVRLRDTRMAFGPISNRRDKGIVRKYVTTISAPSVEYLSNPEVSSVTFDSTGTKLAATMMNYAPTIYSLSDPYPIAVCNATTLPDGSPIPPGERSYRNACTIKHGSFGGAGLPDDPYYCAGSDDFCAYIWKIPASSVLLEQRQEIGASDWPDFDKMGVGFASSFSSTRYVPVNLCTPTSRLTGHQSIVNTALMHAQYPHVLTAGIERDIILHSPTPAAPFSDSGSFEGTPKQLRSLPSISTPESTRLVMSAMGLVESEVDHNDDSTTIALFDQILRQELDADVFAVRRWNERANEDTEDADDSIGDT